MEAAKVLIYRNELLPLSETFILSQARALRRFQPVLSGLMRVNDGLDLTRYPVVTLCGPESPAEKVRRRIFLRTGGTRVFEKAIAVQRPQIIHAHFAVDACAVLPIAKNLRIPLVVTLHGYDVSCSEQVFRRWPTGRAYLRRSRALWEYAGSFLCVSEHVRRRAIASGFPQNKLWTHHIGVQQPNAHRRVLDSDEKTVLFVGRLVEKKGCMYLIRAMARVLETVPNARLMIVGEGPLRNALEREAEIHCRNALFLGGQPHAGVRQWMRRARVLAFPSVQAQNGDSEGLPTVICEAQAEGLPVVAFDTDGVTEALPVERRSCLPKAGDVAAFAEEIVRFLTDDEAWRQASGAGRQFADAHFDLSVQTQRLEDKYEEVIARSRV